MVALGSPTNFHPTEPANNARGPVSPARRAAVDRARAGWIERLIDRSRRNRLLYYRPIKTGDLDLSAADHEAFTSLLHGQAVPAARLLPDADMARTAAVLQQIRRRAQANEEEKGIETLFLAVGLASWPVSDGGTPAAAPVLLVPIEIEVRGREGRSFALKRSGDIQVNPVLLQELEQTFGCRIAPETVFDSAGADDEGFDPEQVFERLQSAARAISGFMVCLAAVLGNFAFQKMAMVRDLRECAEALAAHDLIAALAGDVEARTGLLRSRSEQDPRQLDQAPPDAEFLVLDADSSQQCVIANVLRGQDGVIHGPPGTGKSQTIVNLLAQLAANGKRALFVAEKRAALDVVLRRLNEIGLDHLALDLHGADISRREVIARIGAALHLVRDTPAVDGSSLDRQFSDRRERLNEHARRLHAPRPPSALSVFDMRARLVNVPAEAHSSTRWRGEVLKALTSETIEQIEARLIEAGGFETLLLGTDPSPWTGAAIADSAAADAAIDLVTVLATERWPALLDALARLSSSTVLPASTSLEEAATRIELAENARDFLTRYEQALFNDDLDHLASALQPGVGRLASLWAWSTSGTYRAARNRVLAYRREQVRSGNTVAADAQQAARILVDWRAVGGTAVTPVAAPDLDQMRKCLEAVVADVAALRSILGQDDLPRLPLAALGELVRHLAADTVTPHRLVRMRDLQHELEQYAPGFVKELRANPRSASVWPALFRHAWLSSALAAALAEVPALAGFNGRAHEQFVAEFKTFDRQRLELAVRRVRRAHAERVIAAMNAFPDQTAVVRHEAAKRARHMPLRKLLAAAPDVLTALFPCWMASPLAVSQLMGADRRYFDFVLFDEASQVLPEDAMAALLRAERAVVAGDRNQLPPTAFFAAGEDELADTGDVSATEGFESLLDMMSGFLEPWPLDWHYRSKDERLIAFANHHIYRDRLVTLPSARTDPSITHMLVPAAAADGQEDSPSPEVEGVVRLILAFAAAQMQRPADKRETLGVITLGIKHASRIEATLDHARLDRAELDPFFDEQQLERCFVKNLERVQGDERDAIILTIGAGKGRSGRLDYRAFGPLNSDGGKRRLNVAITRARRRMTVVSSFTHADMDPEHGREGTALLRDYLQYASSGGEVYGDGYATSVPLNPFEADVAETLERAGIPIVPQWGASKYRIDLVAKHPERPGEFVLAIECDGASYHAAPTARDRDRLRQQHLEALGWRFHRIWSTDWFQRREEEIKRTVEAYASAVAAHEHARVSQEVPSAPSIPSIPSPPSVPAAPAGAIPATASGERRGAPPLIAQGLPIDQYYAQQLVDLAIWVQSDGRLRTDDEIRDEMVRVLGYERRGPRIKARLQSVIAAARRRGQL